MNWRKLSVIGFVIFSCMSLIPEVRGEEHESLRVLPLGESLLIPIGRSVNGGNTFQIRIDDKIANYGTFYDGYGGYWAKISTKNFREFSVIKIRYKRHQIADTIYNHGDDSIDPWIRPSFFIDSGNAAIRKQARQIHNDSQTIKENVKTISDFVINHLEFVHKHHQNPPASIKASETLVLQKGVCINYSRLFIALCRASGIATRSISGVVLNREQSGRYDFHHQWAEYMDEEGNWHPIDLTYSETLNLADVRYTDLVYAAEDHKYFAGNTNKSLEAGRPTPLVNKDIILFHYHPIFPGAKYGFELIEDHRPEFFIIEKAIAVSKKGDRIFIGQTSGSSTTLNSIPRNLKKLMELNSKITIQTGSEQKVEKKLQIPNWLRRYNGKTLVFKRRIFKTKKVKFEIDFEQNEIFLTEYTFKNKPTRYQLGLTGHHLGNITGLDNLVATRTNFDDNIILVDLAVPEMGWRAKASYQFSGDSVELNVLDLHGNNYSTNGYIVK